MSHGFSGRANNGATRPKAVDVTRTMMLATPVEYHASDANGDAGSVNAQATYAAVPATISHRGHFDGCQGIGLPAVFALVMYTIQITTGVATRKDQNGAQLGLDTAALAVGWRAASTAT